MFWMITAIVLYVLGVAIARDECMDDLDASKLAKVFIACLYPVLYVAIYATVIVRWLFTR